MRALMKKFGNFMKSKWGLMAAGVLFIAIIVAGILVITNKYGTGNVQNTEVLFHIDGSCQSGIGKTYIGQDGLLYFEDAKSGLSAYICDKVNCPHTMEADCNAYIGAAERIFPYGKSLYIIARDYEGNPLTDFCIYEENLDGSRCKRIISFSGAQLLTGYRLCDGHLLVMYKNDFDYSDPNNPQQLEEAQCGFLCINLEQKEVVEQKFASGQSGIMAATGAEEAYLLIYDSRKNSDGIYTFSEENHTCEVLYELGEIAVISDISDKEFVWSNGENTYLYTFGGEKRQIADFSAGCIYIDKHKVYLQSYDKDVDRIVYYYYDLAKDELKEVGTGEASICGIANDRCYYAVYRDGVAEDGFISVEQYCKEGISYEPDME